MKDFSLLRSKNTTKDLDRQRLVNEVTLYKLEMNFLFILMIHQKVGPL